MVNRSYRLLRHLRQSDPTLSVLDLKAQARGDMYVHQTIKLLVEKPEPILWQPIFTKITSLGRIHPVHPYFIPSSLQYHRHLCRILKSRRRTNAAKGGKALNKA